MREAPGQRQPGPCSWPSSRSHGSSASKAQEAQGEGIQHTDTHVRSWSTSLHKTCLHPPLWTRGTWKVSRGRGHERSTAQDHRSRVRRHRKGGQADEEHQPTAPVGPSCHPNAPPSWAHAAGRGLVHEVAPGHGLRQPVAQRQAHLAAMRTSPGPRAQSQQTKRAASGLWKNCSESSAPSPAGTPAWTEEERAALQPQGQCVPARG